MKHARCIDLYLRDSRPFAPQRHDLRAGVLVDGEDDRVAADS